MNPAVSCAYSRARSHSLFRNSIHDRKGAGQSAVHAPPQQWSLVCSRMVALITWCAPLGATPGFLVIAALIRVDQPSLPLALMLFATTMPLTAPAGVLSISKHEQSMPLPYPVAR